MTPDRARRTRRALIAEAPFNMASAYASVGAIQTGAALWLGATTMQIGLFGSVGSLGLLLVVLAPYLVRMTGGCRRPVIIGLHVVRMAARVAIVIVMIARPAGAVWWLLAVDRRRFHLPRSVPAADPRLDGRRGPRGPAAGVPGQAAVVVDAGRRGRSAGGRRGGRRAGLLAGVRGGVRGRVAVRGGRARHVVHRLRSVRPAAEQALHGHRAGTPVAALHAVPAAVPVSTRHARRAGELPAPAGHPVFCATWG